MSTGAGLISVVGYSIQDFSAIENVLQLRGHLRILTSTSQKMNCFILRTSISYECRVLPCNLPLAMNKTPHSVWCSCTRKIHPMNMTVLTEKKMFYSLVNTLTAPRKMKLYPELPRLSATHHTIRSNLLPAKIVLNRLLQWWSLGLYLEAADFESFESRVAHRHA